MRSRNRPIVTIAVLAISLATVAGAEVLLGTHAVRGRVESVTTTALVIRRSTMARTEMRFVLNASTEREGRLVVGDPVSIRYIRQGGDLIATAVASETRGCKRPNY
jgi:hypothetical protein